ncbi:MAG: hypothetical protein HY680_07160 [Chloroflexi bacterium]|nr:hypothetical protein [Chloroflexota bacterium]
MKGPSNGSLPFELLEGERLHVVLGDRQGLALKVPAQEDYLALTGMRVIASWRREARLRRVAMPLEAVEAVELTELAREVKPLATGILLMLGGLLVPGLAGLLGLNGVVAWSVGAIMVLLGAVTASAYFAREERAVLTFRSGASEAALPLRTAAALRDAYTVASEFFALRAARAAARLRDPYAAGPPYDAAVRWSRDGEEASSGEGASSSSLAEASPDVPGEEPWG